MTHSCDELVRQLATTGCCCFPQSCAHVGVHQHALGLGTSPPAPAAGAVAGANAGGAQHAAAHAPPYGVPGMGAAAAGALGHALRWRGLCESSLCIACCRLETRPCTCSRQHQAPRPVACLRPHCSTRTPERPSCQVPDGGNDGGHSPFSTPHLSGRTHAHTHTCTHSLA